MKGYKFLLLFVFALVAVSTVYAANLELTSVEINNKDVSIADGHSINYKYERGESLDIDVCVQALADTTDAQIEADIFGYKYSNKDTDSKVSDTTDTFDLDANDNDCFTLELKIPTKADQDYYKLRIRVADRDGVAIDNNYELHIKGADSSSAIQIKDYTFNPDSVIAGRAFTSMIKVKNIGTDTLDDVKATIEIPDLNVKASQYLDEIEADESKTFEELLLRVPDCTKAGTYDVVMTVEFDEYESVEKTATIKVTSSDSCGASTVNNNNGNVADKTVVSVPASQEVAQGTSAVYPVMITNAQGASKTYTLSVSGASAWATTRIDPSAVVIVPAGQSKTVYLYVSANSDAEMGDKVATLTVDSGSETKQIPLSVKITKGSNTGNFKNALEIGLVVLVIVLIIIGLVIGFNKLRENKNETEPYY